MFRVCACTSADASLDSSTAENIDWVNFTQRNKHVFVINACTLCVMLMAQSYFWKREVWMIQHLSEDNSVAYNNLPSEVAAFAEFEDAVAGYNRGAFYFALAVATFIIINFGMTTDFLINGDEVYNYNLGSRTITGLLTVRPSAPVASAGTLTLRARATAEHDAREHQGAGLPVLRTLELCQRMVRVCSETCVGLSTVR